MALPGFKTHYYTQKHIHEENLARKKNFEEEYRKQWAEKANYFHKNDVRANKYNQWSSDKAFTTSIEAYKKQNAQISDYKENLDKRRRQLLEMLEKERFMYQEELKHELTDKTQSFDYMKYRAESLKSAREEERKKEAQRLYYEHFRQNNPDLRKIEMELNEKEAINHWPQQIQERQEAKIQLYDEDREYEEMASARLEMEKVKEEEEFQERVLRERTIKDNLRRQIDEMKHRESEARYLKRLEEQLVLEKEEMKDIEHRRYLETERSNKKEYGRTLLRQHAAALRRKSQQIQQEMEEDIRFLSYLAEKDSRNTELATARREKAQRDVAWMREEMERQLRQEREREMELDDMFAEEAARIWTKRENEWEKEKIARENLMKEVLEERNRQIEQKLEETRQKQFESLREREQILEEMERDKSYLNQELVSARDRQDEYKDELSTQIRQNANKKIVSQLDRKKELEEELFEERAYEELLRREAEKMRMEGRPIRSARR